MAAEFVACFEASNQGIWLRNFVTGLRVVDGIERPLKLYCDNNSAVLYSNNNRSTTKSKFIDIKFLVVKERVQNKQISIEHIGTSFMLADMLTKALIPKANTSGKVMVPNTPNQNTFFALPIRKEKRKSPKGIKVVWLRKTTNQQFSIRLKTLKILLQSPINESRFNKVPNIVSS
ncbi:Copia protein, partial [Mucuna pruriens]